MNDEDKQYPDDELDEEDLAAHGMRVDGEDEEESDDEFGGDDADEELI